jgi:hypothetical protein
MFQVSQALGDAVTGNAARRHRAGRSGRQGAGPVGQCRQPFLSRVTLKSGGIRGGSVLLQSGQGRQRHRRCRHARLAMVDHDGSRKSIGSHRSARISSEIHVCCGDMRTRADDVDSRRCRSTGIGQSPTTEIVRSR